MLSHFLHVGYFPHYLSLVVTILWAVKWGRSNKLNSILFFDDMEKVILIQSRSGFRDSLPQSSLTHLQMVQNSAARMLTGTKRWSISRQSNPVFIGSLLIFGIQLKAMLIADRFSSFLMVRPHLISQTLFTGTQLWGLFGRTTYLSCKSHSHK